jgi:hypothetical protein
MYKTKRTPAPYFKVPPPYNPMTGGRASLSPEKPFMGRLAMFQVCQEDIYDNFVVCRGVDPEMQVYFDDEHTMCVAKPYELRGTYPYVVGQVICCAKVRGKLGDNPGVAATTMGQPADLDEEVEMLTTADDENSTGTEFPIFWIHVGGGVSLTAFELKTSLTPWGTASGWKLTFDKEIEDYAAPDYESETDIDVTDVQQCHRSLGYDDTAEEERGAIGFCDSNGAVVSIRQQAKMCYCQAKISTGHTLATVDHVVPMDGGQSPVESETEEVSVASGFTTNNDAYGIIAWDETSDTWRPLDFPCSS